jgi:serine/threonine protein phosphatase 1
MWWAFGGAEAMESYGDLRRVVPREHIELMERALPYWETPSTIFIHANLQPGVPLEKQNGEWLRWMHLTGKEPPFDPPRRVVCGHTPQKHGYPIAFPGWVGIDTFAHGGGWLTCMDVNANWIWQATDFGQTREFPLGGEYRRRI